MDPIKISIIIPVYNSASFLRKCIDSLLNQTYHNLEIILIDDGSKDDSNNICRYYQNLDNRILFIEQENMGVSNTRNNGIRIATGDYIMFVDSDDYVSNDLCQILIDNSNDGSDDLIFCSYSQVSTSGKIIDGNSLYEYHNKIRRVSDLAGENFDFFYKNLYFNTPVCKLYKRSIIGNCTFDSSLSLGEDLLFNLDFLKNCEYISFVNSSLYFYLIGQQNSLSSRQFSNRLDVVKNVFERSMKGFEKLFKDKYNKSLIMANYFIEVCLCLKKMLSTNYLSDVEKIEYLYMFSYSEKMEELYILKQFCWKHIPMSYRFFYIILVNRLFRTLLFVTKLFNLLKR